MRDRYAERIVRLEIAVAGLVQGFIAIADKAGIPTPPECAEVVEAMKIDIERFDLSGQI